MGRQITPELDAALANLVAAVEFSDKVRAASAAGEDTTGTGAFRDSREWLTEAAQGVASAVKTLTTGA